MQKKKESEFDKLARLIKSEGQDIRGEVSELRADVGNVRTEVGGLRKEMHEGFAGINRRLDHIIQMQLDEHARRVKKLETTTRRTRGASSSQARSAASSASSSASSDGDQQ